MVEYRVKHGLTDSSCYYDFWLSGNIIPRPIGREVHAAQDQQSFARFNLVFPYFVNVKENKYVM